MRLLIVTGMVVGALSLGIAGCEPRPVVVEPDEGETVIEEDRDVDVDRNATEQPPASEPGVGVQVGGEDGVEVNVDGDQQNEPNPNSNP